MNRSKLEKAIAYNQKQFDLGELTMEQITKMTLHWQDTHELEADGMAGKITLSSIDAVLAPEAPPMVLGPDGNLAVAGKLSHWDGPEERQPSNRRELYAMLGSPGQAGHPDKEWERQNIISCHQTLGNRLPGVPAKWWVQVHKRVEPYLREALRRVQVVAPDFEIERIGSHNFRHIRHDPNRPLSVHSWGAAIDLNPHENRGVSFKSGEAPKAWSPEYMKIWPNGVTPEVVEAFSSCGFAWGSDWDEDGETHDHTFLDPMHFEWIARDGNAIEV